MEMPIQHSIQNHLMRYHKMKLIINFLLKIFYSCNIIMTNMFILYNMTLHYVVYIDTRSFTHAHSILYDEANQMQVDLV